MVTTNGSLQMFLLKADGLARCRWDDRTEQVEVLDRALEGETVRQIARDAASPQKLYAATLTEIHVSENGGETWKWLPARRHRLPRHLGDGSTSDAAR